MFTTFRRWLEGQKWIGNVVYWLRTHTVDRYHLIDLRGQGDYKWGWIDRDYAMYLACFKLLVDYVEKECPFETIDWSATEEHARIGEEIRTLYAWWKEGRAKEHAEVDAIPGPSGYEGPEWEVYTRRAEELEVKDEEMLARLMKIRRHLWT